MEGNAAEIIRKCSFPGCNRGRRKRGLCETHYSRMRRNDDPKMKARIVWDGIHQRCENQLNKDYSRYGAKGIYVCSEWLTLNGFIKDMGTPEKGYQLHRIDNNGPYNKENCKWVEIKEHSHGHHPKGVPLWKRLEVGDLP